jgi:hypothetical protein
MPRDPEVNLKIKADDRELAKVGRAQKKAFDKRDIREFTRAGRDLERQIADLTKRQISLNEAIRKVDKGTDDYKKFTRQLGDANDEATQLERTLGRVNQTLSRARREEDKSRQRRQGFVGGLGQGLGVAEYLPTGAQQAPRMAGAMLGRGVRRGVGAVTSPFLTPGVGGMAQGFAGIPIVGGFAAGAMQSAAGFYQQAVGFHQQRRGALFAQGGGFSAEQMASRRQIAAQEAQRVRREGKIAAQEAAIVRRRQLKVLAQKTAGAALTAKEGPAKALGRVLSGKAMAKGGDVPVYAEPGGPIVGEMDEFQRRYPGGTYKDYQAWRKKLAKTPVAPIRADPGRILKETEQRAKAIQAAAKRQPAGLPGAGAGVQFGLGPQEMMQGFTQFMQARGGTYDDVRRSQFKEQMAATTYGVSAQQAGQFARMGIAGGGGQGMYQGLAGVLQSAVAQGLRGSQVTEYLQTLVGLGQQAERSGVKINVRDFTHTAAQLRGAGLQGLQAQRVAGGLQQAAMGVSQRGVQNPMDVMLIRAAGYDPSQGPEGYAAALEKLEGGMSPEIQQRLLSSMASGAEAGGGGPKMQRLMMRRAMGRLGVLTGSKDAGRMLARGRGEGGEAERRMIHQGDRLFAGDRLITEARGRVRRGAGLTIGSAGLQAGQVGVGGRAASWVLPLERASMKAASAITRLPIEKFSKAVERATVALDKLLSGKLAAEGPVDMLKIMWDAIAGKVSPTGGLLPGT